MTGVELVEFFADLVGTLQLVEQVGDGQFVVRILNLVKGSRFRLLTFSGVDLKPVLLFIFLSAFEHTFAKVLFGLLRFLGL